MPAIDLTPYNQPQGSTSDGTKYDNALALLQSTLNGLDNNNFAAGKIFDPSKLMQNSAVDGDGLAYDSASGTWKRTTDKALRVAALAPGSNGQVLTTTGGVAVWGAAAAGATTYRKTTAKTVNTTVAETDLLNGEITVGAGVIGSTGVCRLTAVGDWLNTSGGGTSAPRLRVKLGAGPTTIIDMGASTAQSASSATRMGWRVVVEIMNLGATNVQAVSFTLNMAINGTAGDWAAATGEGSFGHATTGASGPGAAYGMVYNAAAIDTTAAMNLLLTVVNASANANYETKLLGALVEII